MKTTEKGTFYFELDDFKDLCGKCRNAYNNDWQFLDCDYCKLPVIVKSYQSLIYQNEDLEKLYNFYKSISLRNRSDEAEK